MNEFFIKVVMNLCNKHGVNLDIASYSNELDVYEALVEKGITEGDIMSAFEMAISLPFYDIGKEQFAIDDIDSNKIGDLINHIKIYPFRKDGELIVAVSSPEQMDYAENVMMTKNYVFCFAYQFLIDMCLGDIDIDAVNTVSDIDHAEKALSAVNTDRKTILLASGQDEINKIVAESEMFNHSYLTTAELSDRNLLIEYCEIEAPDILLIGDNIGGKSALTEILLKIKFTFPGTRIVYLAGEVDAKDTARKASLGALVAAGIYDIVTKNSISVSYLKNVLDNPTEPSEVKYFLEFVKDSGSKKKNAITIFVPETVEENDVLIYDNLYSFTSSKGGVGKTFIIEQLAIAIATCGIQRTNGTKPRVGIIDLDFEGFGVSNFFGTLNKENNIFVAAEEAKKIIDELGEQRDVDISTSKYVNERIRQMFRTSNKFSNIKVLGGTDKVYHVGDRNILNKYILTFIVETVLDDFDVLLVDINTDMDTSIVYPLYTLSNNTYFVIDMNWNAFHNNKRYLMHLEENNMYMPDQSKFILNKAISNNEMYIGFKDIEAGLGVHFTDIFPFIDPTIMFNFSCKGENIIQHGGRELSEEKYHFLRLANEIYPIKDFDILSSQYEGKTRIKTTKKDKKESLNKKSEKNDTGEIKKSEGKKQLFNLKKLLPNKKEHKKD